MIRFRFLSLFLCVSLLISTVQAQFEFWKVVNDTDYLVLVKQGEVIPTSTPERGLRLKLDGRFTLVVPATLAERYPEAYQNVQAYITALAVEQGKTYYESITGNDEVRKVRVENLFFTLKNFFNRAVTTAVVAAPEAQMLGSRGGVAAPCIGCTVQAFIQEWSTSESFPAGHRLFDDLDKLDEAQEKSLRSALVVVLTGGNLSSVVRGSQGINEEVDRIRVAQAPVASLSERCAIAHVLFIRLKPLLSTENQEELDRSIQTFINANPRVIGWLAEVAETVTSEELAKQLVAPIHAYLSSGDTQAQTMRAFSFSSGGGRFGNSLQSIISLLTEKPALLDVVLPQDDFMRPVRGVVLQEVFNNLLAPPVQQVPDNIVQALSGIEGDDIFCVLRNAYCHPLDYKDGRRFTPEERKASLAVLTGQLLPAVSEHDREESRRGLKLFGMGLKSDVGTFERMGKERLDDEWRQNFESDREYFYGMVFSRIRDAVGPNGEVGGYKIRDNYHSDKPALLVALGTLLTVIIWRATRFRRLASARRDFAQQKEDFIALWADDEPEFCDRLQTQKVSRYSPSVKDMLSEMAVREDISAEQKETVSALQKSGETLEEQRKKGTMPPGWVGVAGIGATLALLLRSWWLNRKVIPLQP